MIEKDKITQLKASSLAPTERRCGLTRYVFVARAGAAGLSPHTFSTYRSQKRFQSEEYKANILEL